MTSTERPAAAARDTDTRSPFERFVELAQRAVARPMTFTVVIAVTLLWAASFPLFHHIAEWHAVIHSVASITSLLMLVLLENAGRRADEAGQEKLNVMSEALVALLEERAATTDAEAGSRTSLIERADRLREAVGLETRH